MRRLSLFAGATAAAIALVVPAAAHARDDGTIEVLRLQCSARVTDTTAVVRCEWSAPASAEAAGLRLWRLDPAIDDHRLVVFRTDDTTDTAYTDTAVRRGHRYVYAVQAVDAGGRVVAQSRPAWVPVPGGTDVEVLRLRCALGPAHGAIGCEWSTPEHPDAHVVELWRSVDRGGRELVGSFRPTGPNAYRDPVPAGASKVTYAVLAKNALGHIVARSRAERVRIPDDAATAVTVATIAPTRTDPPVARPIDTTTTTTTATRTAATTPTTSPTTTTPTTTPTDPAPVATVGPTRPAATTTTTVSTEPGPARTAPPQRERVSP